MFQKQYAKYYDQINSQKPYEKEIGFIYRWAKRPKTVFDIGCGTASYWKYYPKGTEIFGVDKSREMARQNGQVVCADIQTYKTETLYDCATALFDVLNYIKKHGWWGSIPIRKGGYFIFDIWDTKKIEREGFRKTWRACNGLFRSIDPIQRKGKQVSLEISLIGSRFSYKETHTMYLHSHEDIVRYCGSNLKIIDIRPTKTWQTFYKCEKR